jgi:hypothetical protein
VQLIVDMCRSIPAVLRVTAVRAERHSITSSPTLHRGAALVVIGESMGESARQSATASVSRFMGDSFRFNDFSFYRGVFGRRADSTPGNSKCEEKKPGETDSP